MIMEGAGNVNLLTACPDGKHFAFFAKTGLHLMDVTGSEVWMCHLDADKSTPYGIRFSPSGDAVMFIHNYGDDVGLYCIWLYELERKRATQLWCDSPIGCDADLRYFMVGRNYYRWGYDQVLQGSEIPQPGDTTRERGTIATRLDGEPVILDRDMFPKWQASPIRPWRGSAVQRNGEGVVVLEEDGSLQWFSVDSVGPDVAIRGCISQRLDCATQRVGHVMLGAHDDMVLIQPAMVEHAMLVNRNIGIVWEADDLSSATLKGQRVIAHYNDGTVEVLRSDGSVEVRYAPLSGCKAVAADIIGDALFLACTVDEGQTIEVEAFALAGC
ncbi:MAG: hypothetical protein Q7S20_08085 [Gemmatimonadaceae bacterium]|nr:hypothetical protein [Gemmatimonadaceae bacterium]